MNWRLLLITLSAAQASLRIRIWRRFKAAGAVLLRDGVWLWPESATQAGWADLLEEVREVGGEAESLRCQAVDTEQAARFMALFDRRAEYEKWLDTLKATAPGVRAAARLRRELSALEKIDFFPTEWQSVAREAMLRFEQTSSPHEPNAYQADIARLDRASYQGRVWATRARPWVDRLASAWLIHRHIDPAARFIWLAQPGDCPADALGFDYDGATFSHVGERVSFETLLASFGLEANPGLAHMARIIHFLDVGGLPTPEAAGLETILAGMRASLKDDNDLLAAAGQTFDYLYSQYGESRHE